MELRRKLETLMNQPGLTLYRWIPGRSRMANEFIPLSEMRLVSVSCARRGELWYSMAAPVLYLDKGFPKVMMADSDVYTILEGKRPGVNVFSRLLRKGEKAKQTTRCCSGMVTDRDVGPKHVQNMVMSLDERVPTPVCRIVVPDMFRISKDPVRLKPRITQELLTVIGSRPSDSPDEVRRKFLQALPLLGADTGDGWVVPADYVVAGGCVVVGSRGISARAGSVVHAVATDLFRMDVLQRSWSVCTGADADVTDIGQLDAYGEDDEE